MNIITKIVVLAGLCFSFFNVDAFEKHDDKFRYNQFERNFQISNVKCDSIQAEYVSTANVQLFFQMKFYLDSVQRIEITVFGDSLCIYRQFYKNQEIATGQLSINTTKFDAFTETFADQNSDDSTSLEKCYYLHRQGEWMEAELIGDIFIEETQLFKNGKKHGVFEKKLWHFVLEINEYFDDKLISNSVLYKTDFSSDDFIGIWNFNRQSKYCNDCLYNGNSFYQINKGDTQSNLMRIEFFPNGKYSLSEYLPVCHTCQDKNKEYEGEWYLNEGNNIVILTGYRFSIKIIYVFEDFILVDFVNND